MQSGKRGLYREGKAKMIAAEEAVVSNDHMRSQDSITEEGTKGLISLMEKVYRERGFDFRGYDAARPPRPETGTGSGGATYCEHFLASLDPLGLAFHKWICQGQVWARECGTWNSEYINRELRIRS